MSTTAMPRRTFRPAASQATAYALSCLASISIFLGHAKAADTMVPVSMFSTEDPNLEVVAWATAPDVKNPTNIDTDSQGRIWVAEGVNYRSHYNRQPAGDRIMVHQDTDGDGKADKSWIFVQEPFLRAPMGIAVLDNKVIVSMAPDIIVYTDVNRDARFDPAVDKREVLLTGFNGRVHDHTIHSVTIAADGQWYWNAGNCGALFSDKSGRIFRIGSSYDPYYGGKPSGDLGWDPRKIAGQRSDDGFVYVGGFAARMTPDAGHIHIIGHNFRNSYEQVVTSFGDVFQNDNDDPPACRTAFLMEYGNAGFSSFDGKRSWQADQRPGQSVATAEWRQEDPGTMPAGDVYGGGSPTGIAFVEDSLLGKKNRGLLLSCEPGRNVVFGYYPKPTGAGFELKRFDFLTSNKERKFEGGDFNGGRGAKELPILFRPSDVVVGADGAIYVADFFDPRVGGHSDQDNTTSGTIYRIAPKGSKVRVPKIDLTTLDGAIAALRSPALHVRAAAGDFIRTQGEKAVTPVAKLLRDENPYMRARAVWLLSQLGSTGLSKVEPLLKDRDPATRTVAFRALRRDLEQKGSDSFKAMADLSLRMSEDESAAVRREAALALRGIPFDLSGPALTRIAQSFDGQDRWLLEAIGTAAQGSESQLYQALLDGESGRPADQWSPRMAWLAWRLHPESSTSALQTRVSSKNLPLSERKNAITALAYIGTRAAVDGILSAGQDSDSTLKNEALWWLLNRKNNSWKSYALDSELKRRKIYDPESIELMASTMPEPSGVKAPTKDEVLAAKGNPTRGKEQVSRCVMCHHIGEQGNNVGPDLTRFGRAQTTDVLIQSILNPSADIAHGFGAHEIITKDGLHIQGLIVMDGDPVVMTSAGGLSQTIPAAKIQSKKPLGRSLMWTPEALGLTAQDVADLVAYLKSL